MSNRNDTQIEESESWRRFWLFANRTFFGRHCSTIEAEFILAARQILPELLVPFWCILVASRPNREPGIFRQNWQSSLQTSENAGWRRKSAHNCGRGASLMKSITWREAILGGFCERGTDGLLANIKTLIIVHKRLHNVSTGMAVKQLALTISASSAHHRPTTHQHVSRPERLTSSGNVGHHDHWSTPWSTSWSTPWSEPWSTLTSTPPPSLSPVLQYHQQHHWQNIWLNTNINYEDNQDHHHFINTMSNYHGVTFVTTLYD